LKVFAAILFVVGVFCAFYFTGGDEDESSESKPPTTSADVKFTIPYEDALSSRAPLSRIVQPINSESDD
jgi:hypothetical protein